VILTQTFEEVKCTKCNAVKPISSFLRGRKGQKSEYRFSYCLDCRRAQLYSKLNGNVESYLKDRWNRLVIRATKNNTPIDITWEYFLDLYKRQDGKCFYTDIVLVCRVGEGKSRHSLSIDRIDNNLGYIKGNVVLCTNQVNTAKGDFTLDEIKQYMPKWYRRISDFRG